MENLHREIDPFSTELMQEDGFKSAAAPECKGQLGWVYRNGFCYMFTRYKANFFLEINFPKWTSMIYPLDLLKPNT